MRGSCSAKDLSAPAYNVRTPKPPPEAHQKTPKTQLPTLCKIESVSMFGLVFPVAGDCNPACIVPRADEKKKLQVYLKHPRIDLEKS